MTVTDTRVRVVDSVDVLLDRMTFAGEGRFVDLEVDRGDDAAISGYAIAGFDDDDVSGNQLDRRHGLHLSVTTHAGGRREHSLQSVEGCFGAIFLDEADGGVGEDHHQNHQRCLQFSGDREADRGGAEKDEDQEVLELKDELLPGGYARFGVEGVRAVSGQSATNFVGGQTIDRGDQSSHDRVAVGLMMCERIIDCRRHRNLSDAAVADGRRSLPP